ncbi:uncharacterized protein LOC141898626 isoform X2 [Tubulanus polymorphus]|uniref:uncharacterized protein LOC141898626 isoform X2 n=1 Tax=Tubulanus polymorphus TaxID=672921 RepID=UPI003DA3F464
MSKDTNVQKAEPEEGILPDMTVDDWVKSWEEGDIGFHRDHVHPLLLKYFDRILGNKSVMKVFFPMCGKSVDMKWLADKGHCVCGVEYAEKGVKEFFDEQNLEFTVTEVPEVKGKLYKSSCGKIKIYCCDFYNFTSNLEGKFDLIWDRGSFICLAESDRTRYSEIIKSLLDPSGVYYIVSYFYEKDGVPLYGSMNGTEMNQLYGDVCDIETLELAPADWAPLMGFDIRLQSVKKRDTADKPALSNILGTGDWEQKWDAPVQGFHLNEPNPVLVKNSDKLLATRKIDSKVYLPMCGRSNDLKWFYEKGYHVVGVEFIKKAVERFFTEEKYDYTIEEVPEVNGACYKTTDNRLRIYVCDVFKFMEKQIEFDFDVIFDRGAFVAINEVDQKRYSELMIASMAKDCHCLLVTYLYDPTRYGGPPHCVPNGRIEELYGKDCDIEHLELEDMTPLSQKYRESWNLTKIEYRSTFIKKHA